MWPQRHLQFLQCFMQSKLPPKNLEQVSVDTFCLTCFAFKLWNVYDYNPLKGAVDKWRHHRHWPNQEGSKRLLRPFYGRHQFGFGISGALSNIYVRSSSSLPKSGELTLYTISCNTDHPANIRLTKISGHRSSWKVKIYPDFCCCQFSFLVQKKGEVWIECNFTCLV